jgi:hypothetical protein
MGFRFSSFIAGAAERMTETLKEDEKTAAAAASFGVKALKENYDKIQAENRKLESELSESIKFLKTNDPSATESEVFAAATNKAYMAMAVEAAKTNPGSFRIRDTVKIAEENQSPLTAMEQLKAYVSIPAVAKAVRAAEEGTKLSPKVATEPTALSEFSLSALRERAGTRAGDKAASQTAAAMGVPLEKLRAASGYTRPELDTKAEYDMSGFAKPKSFDQQENDAQSALLKATKENDPKKANEAKADLMIIQDVKNSLTAPQTAFANKIADIKNRYMFGTPEQRKAAKPEYDQLMADIRAEALAKKVTKDGEGEGKIPALSTLNTFTSASVARAVAAKHGDLIKTKQLAIVEKADGTVGIDYIGDNDTLRRQILETQANAAKNALSLYTDAEGKPLNRDVASVMNSFTSVVPSVIRTDGGAAPAAAAGPQPAAKPTLPTPTAKPASTNAATLRREGEAAIARGADRGAVAKRYKEQTGQEF